ncbi:MAG: MGMT family protein [Lentisphaerae bacterium]|nr:MGMT family protein [Lentisphaerota bacterium]
MRVGDKNSRDIIKPGIRKTDTGSPNIGDPDIDNSGIGDPDINNPNISEPDINNPGISRPDIISPGKTGFFERVYEIVGKIPKGKVATYGQIAIMLGEPGKAKIVGWALHSNPYRGKVPCHRVVNRFGECSGSFAFGGIDVQRGLLENEGVEFDEEGRVDLKRFLWSE